ncbi:MAG TPA: DUF1223 domain-containing protein, partial [Polyangia bacterium]|nr:DUF1223 domain-containing protein [Polyangia bacterium]
MKARSVVLLAAAFVCLAAGCSSTARGAPAPWRRAVLVELYTSQGCSSCPPADAFVRELPALGFGRDRVIPLTFHVDYWDRLGWKDPFASGAFTERQQWYARSPNLRSPDGAAGLDGLYTPQMIVDGTVQFSGQRRQTALREMERAGGRPPPLDLEVRATVKGSTIDLTVGSSRAEGTGRDRDWRIVAALAARTARTAVGRGENAGETLNEVAVVRALSDRVPLPPPRTPARLQLS